MRKYCLKCVIKHLGQAFVTQIESSMGYPEHILLTIGHLSEASEECFLASEELANEIRQHRLKLMEKSSYEVPYFDLYNKTKQLMSEKGCGDCKDAKDDFKERLKQKKEEKEENNEQKK